MKFILGYVIVAVCAIAVLTEVPATPPKANPAPPAAAQTAKLHR